MGIGKLKQLQEFGQSVWMDFISRGVIKSGELKKLIDEDGLRGVTTNPTIFEKSISGSGDYDEAVTSLIRQDKTSGQIMWALMIEDVQAAADIFRPLNDELDGQDGFVSIEVSPHLAYDTGGTVREAMRLWTAVNRPNIFVKVPATLEGLSATRQLISEGINVNITLLFGLPRYEQVATAYIRGLEERAKAGKPIDRIASVASFFLSRIDVMLDPALEEKNRLGQSPALHGEVAIASAKAAYLMYKEIFGGHRFKTLADKGARVQRLLWASTSTKNPAYSDVKYVEPLIGRDTVNTMPPETINAYRDHGSPTESIERNADKAHGIFQTLRKIGIDIDSTTDTLEREGVYKFVKAFDSLKETIQKKIEAAHAGAGK